jgi:hypothetical protein
MKLLTLLLLTSLTTQGQKWYKITGNDAGLIISSATAGGFYGWNQAIVHHHWGRGNKFYDINTSWENKYKDFDKGDLRAKYFLSKSLLVAGTDGFHMTQAVYRTAGLVTLAFAFSDFKQYKKRDRWKVVVKKLVLCTLAERLAFVAVFNGLESQ